MKASKNFKALYVKRPHETGWHRANTSVDELALYLEMLDLFAPGTAKTIILKGEDIVLPNDSVYKYQ